MLLKCPARQLKATWEHIDSIKAKHEEINKYMDDQFGELVNAATKEINEAGDAALGYAKDDMGTHTDSW